MRILIRSIISLWKSFISFFSTIQNPSASNEELEFLNDFNSNPNISIPFVNFELKVSLVFNLVSLASFILFFLPYAEECYKCDSLLSSWFIILNIMVFIMVPPKLWCISTINQLNTDQVEEDTTHLSRAMNEFFNSRGSRIATKISKTIFFMYIYGTFRAWQTRNLVCPNNFLHIVRSLICSVFLRLFISFVRLLISNPQSFIELSEGISQSELSKLQLKVVGSSYPPGNDCSICLESMNILQTVRIMRCPGLHAFHSPCIDKWLFKKKVCPNCNLNVFQMNE